MYFEAASLFRTYIHARGVFQTKISNTISRRNILRMVHKEKGISNKDFQRQEVVSIHLEDAIDHEFQGRKRMSQLTILLERNESGIRNTMMLQVLSFSPSQ